MTFRGLFSMNGWEMVMKLASEAVQGKPNVINPIKKSFLWTKQMKWKVKMGQLKDEFVTGTVMSFAISLHLSLLMSRLLAATVFWAE